MSQVRGRVKTLVAAKIESSYDLKNNKAERVKRLMQNSSFIYPGDIMVSKPFNLQSFSSILFIRPV